MKSLPAILLATVCALTVLPASAAIEVAETVEYVSGAKPDDATCTWEASLVSSVASHSKAAITLADKATAPSGLNLALQVVRLNLTSSSRKSEYTAVVRANVLDGGKLVATKDFNDDNSFKSGQPACDALRALGSSLGENVAEWTTQTHFIECRDDCAGIHPDEPIVLGAEILPGNADAINGTVRDECHWPSAMVSRLVKSFNERDPSPRGKLEARPIDIESYAGRRLVLRAIDVHAVGGGSFSGPKWMTLSGELREGKTLVGSFESRSTSGRGLTTCRSVDSLSDSTASMIVDWLRNPTVGAKLN